MARGSSISSDWPFSALAWVMARPGPCAMLAREMKLRSAVAYGVALVELATSIVLGASGAAPA